MNVRLRRLQADHGLVTATFAAHPSIHLLATEGDPPERYRFEYLLRGLVVQGGDVVEKEHHLVEFYLTLGYPRQAPLCRMLSPIFHPNIAPHAVCIGDHWTAGESLAALVTRVGELITYQSYNLKSPLNGEAARWAAENLWRFPLDDRDVGAVGDSS
jgi:ubiquitin-protein ligase